MVGDTTSDIEAGRRAGVRTILLRTGHAGTDAKQAVRPDYIAPDLADAVDWILDGHTDLARRIAPIALEVSRGRRIVLIGGLARAGKSYSAQVLKELLHALGREAHVISLDGWLKPKDERGEGTGVRNRYDLAAASAAITTVARATSRSLLSEPLYNRATRNPGSQQMEHSVGPEDVLIVEGVPALLIDDLLAMPKTVKVYVDVIRATREDRLLKDYAWRETSTEERTAMLAARELDETSVIEQSRKISDFVVQPKEVKGAE
jgi:uridine kinase